METHTGQEHLFCTSIAGKLGLIQNKGYKCKHKKQNHGVNRQHNDIFDDARGKNRHKGLATQHREPQRVQTAVHNQFYQKFGNENAPYPDGLPVQDETVYDAGNLDIERIAKEKGASVRL